MRDFSRRDFLRQTNVTLAMAALAARATPGQAASTTTVDATAFIDASGEELILGGRPLSWWIEAFGLPFHVSYAPDIPANLYAFKDVFARLYRKGKIRYAGKASTHPAVFRLASEAGVGIDVASPFETRCAFDAGVSPQMLDVNGNAKDDGLLNLAISKDMLIIADSIAELERIATLAKDQQRTPRVMLRVTGFSLDRGVVNYCEAIVALPARKWALATLPQRRDPAPFETFIAGNLCFSADMLSRLKVAFPRRPLRGDSSTGAYTIRPSSPPTPTPSRGPRALSTRRTAIGPI